MLVTSGRGKRSQAETGLSREILFVLYGPGLQFLEELGFVNPPHSKKGGRNSKGRFPGELPHKVFGVGEG